MYICSILVLYLFLLCENVIGWKKPLDSWLKFEDEFSEKRKAKEKFNDIWTLLETAGTVLPPYDNAFNFLKYLNLIPFLPGLRLPSITSMSLFRPWTLDHKVLHTRAAYASSRILFNNESRKYYTGLFEAPEINHVLLSYSPGFRVPNMTNFFATSMRLFRDNQPAGTIIGAFNFLSLPNWNIFDYMICSHYNWLMALPLMPLGPLKPGQGWTRYFNQFGLSNLAEYTLSGEEIKTPKFPWGICFIPTHELQQRFQGSPPSHDVVELLRLIKPGDHLYDIWAIKEPYPLVHPPLMKQYSHHIGHLEVTSTFISSTYGSQRLLGTHQPFEYDLKYRPDWIPFSKPSLLSRAGAIGVYKSLFPTPRIDIHALDQNLYFLMTGLFKAFSSKNNFQQFIQKQFGMTPRQIYQDIIQYIQIDVINDFKQNQSNQTTYMYTGYTIHSVLNMIYNIAAYARHVGLPPPLHPEQMIFLGLKKARNHAALIDLVKSAATATCNQLNNVNERCPLSLGLLAAKNEHISLTNNQTIREQESHYLHVGNTLFHKVRVLPLHLELFNLLAYA